MLSRTEVIERKFLDWRNGIGKRNRQIIKRTIDIVMYGLIILSLVLAFQAGKSAGKAEYCADNGLLLVEYRGISECWTYDAYNALVQQFNNTKDLGNIANGIQFNNS